MSGKPLLGAHAKPRMQLHFTKGAR